MRHQPARKQMALAPTTAPLTHPLLPRPNSPTIPPSPPSPPSPARNSPENDSRQAELVAMGLDGAPILLEVCSSSGQIRPCSTITVPPRSGDKIRPEIGRQLMRRESLGGGEGLCGKDNGRGCLFWQLEKHRHGGRIGGGEWRWEGQSCVEQSTQGRAAATPDGQQIRMEEQRIPCAWS